MIFGLKLTSVRLNTDRKQMRRTKIKNKEKLK